MAFPNTFKDLQDGVIDKARLDSDFDVSRVKDWLNSAYFTAIVETGFYQSTQVAAPLTADQTSIQVPAGIHKIEFITPTGIDGQIWGPMRHTSSRICSGSERGRAARSAPAPPPAQLPLRARAHDRVLAAGGRGRGITFYGWGLPAPMVADGDPPIIPDPYSMVIEYGALIHAAEFQKDLLMIQQFQSEYQDWIQRFRGYKNHLPSSQPDQFIVEFARPWPSRNDVDTGI